MPTPESAYKTSHGGAFIQFYDGGPVYPLGQCFSADSAPDPKPGKDPQWCMGANGQWFQIGSVSTVPSGLPGFNLTTYVPKAADYLEKVKDAGCPFNLFFTLADCGLTDVFNNRQRTYAYKGAIITDDPLANPTQMGTDAFIEHTWNIVADYGRMDHRPLTFARIPTTETAALNSIQACVGQCAGDCGPYVPICENLWVSADTVAAAIPDLLYSQDNADTWATVASGFAAGESVLATVCIEIDKDTTRIISVRDGDAAAPLEIQYSDDDGVTQTLVVVGATNNEAAVGGSSLFAYNANNIWLATDDGRVFYSSDFAETWTDQTTALAASGAAALNAIHFCTSQIGYAVGAGDVVIYTVDGGNTWVAGTATGSGDGLNTVHCFDKDRVIIGTDSAVSASPVYMSFDQTANWTTITQGLDIAATDTVAHIAFRDDGMTGFLIKNTVAPVGYVYKSIDGGRSWKVMNLVTNSGLNFLHICQNNLVYVVGEVNAATSFIGRVSG